MAVCSLSVRPDGGSSEWRRRRQSDFDRRDEILVENLEAALWRAFQQRARPGVERRAGPKTRTAPGGAASLRRRTHPGRPKRWSDPPSVERRALTCISTLSHRPSCSRGSPAGDARMCGHTAGEPALLPFGRCSRLPRLCTRSSSTTGCPISESGVGARCAGFTQPRGSSTPHRSPDDGARLRRLLPVARSAMPSSLRSLWPANRPPSPELRPRSVGEPTPLASDAVPRRPGEPDRRDGAARLSDEQSSWGAPFVFRPGRPTTPNRRRTDCPGR